MPSAGWSPKIVPYGADQTVYLVVDSFGTSGTVYRETEVERTDLETIISDFMLGKFNDPVRVVAFNTLEHWSEDMSANVAAEIQIRCDIDIAIARSCIRSGARGWAGIRIVDDGAYYSFPIWPENELLMADRGAQRDVMITATAPQGFETVHPIGTKASDETATFGYPRERSC